MLEWIILIIAVGILVLVLVLPFVLLGVSSAKEYNARADNDYIINIKDYKELEVQKIDFKNLSGQTLKGYKFFKNDRQYKAVILIIPGFKNNHNNYLPEIDYFTSQDYLVFSFDPTSTGKSEGKGVKGLLQIPYDAQCALEVIKQDSTLNQKPLFLWGYSNGAFASLTLINDEKVVAAASLSAFDDVNKMTVDNAVSSFGKKAILIYPYCVIFNRLKYGKNPFGSALANLKRCNKPVFLAHGTDDKVVPYTNFLNLKKYNTHPLSVNLTIQGGDHWIRYEPKVHRVRNKLRAKLQKNQGDKDLLRCCSNISKRINFDLVKQTADFFDKLI